MSNRDNDIDYGQLATALRFIFNQSIKDAHTALPGNIVQYNSATKRAIVQPAIRLKLTTGESIPRAQIANVPIIHPAGGGYVIHFPLQPGDPVMLVFSERGITEFKRTFALANPDTDSMLSEKDAVAFPAFGGLNISPANANGISIQSESGETHIVIQGNQMMMTAPGGLTITGDVSIAGNVQMNGGSITHNGREIGDTHTHSGVIPGGGNTGAPV